MKFDLWGHLPFNVHQVYAHREAEVFLAERRQCDESYPSDLISCELDLHEYLTSHQIVSAVFECEMIDSPALAIVWDCSDSHNRLVKINNKFKSKEELLESSEIDSESRELGLRLAIQHRDRAAAQVIREYKGLVCLASDEDGIKDALSKQGSPMI